MSEIEIWGVIFLKVIIFKIVFDIAIALLSAWMSAVAKVKASDGIRELFKDLDKMKGSDD
jgi:galactitol-specific phosphotransferase system IIC component